MFFLALQFRAPFLEVFKIASVTNISPTAIGYGSWHASAVALCPCRVCRWRLRNPRLVPNCPVGSPIWRVQGGHADWKRAERSPRVARANDKLERRAISSLAFAPLKGKGRRSFYFTLRLLPTIAFLLLLASRGFPGLLSSVNFTAFNFWGFSFSSILLWSLAQLFSSSSSACMTATNMFLFARFRAHEYIAHCRFLVFAAPCDSFLILCLQIDYCEVFFIY